MQKNSGNYGQSSSAVGGKFSETSLEKTRSMYDDIGENTQDPKDDLTYEEFYEAIKKMKRGKATGPVKDRWCKDIVKE